jgi:hypothetical protein
LHGGGAAPIRLLASGETAPPAYPDALDASELNSDECNVPTRWKYEGKLVVCGRKDIIDGVISAVDYLNILQRAFTLED